MLIVNYCEQGNAYSDFEVLKEVEQWIGVNNQGNIQKNVSTENIINAFRLAIIRDQISIADIQFQFRGVNLQVNELGVFSEMPKGFLDNNGSILRDIVRERNKKGL